MSGAIDAVVNVATKASTFLGKFSVPLTIATTLYQYTQSRKSVKEAKKQKDIQEAKERAQRRVNETEAEKARREMLRQRAVTEGETMTTAAAGGTAYGGTSSFTGAMGSLASQYATGITDINRQQELGQGLSAYNTQLGQSQTKQFGYAQNIAGAQLFTKTLETINKNKNPFEIPKIG